MTIREAIKAVASCYECALENRTPVVMTQEVAFTILRYCRMEDRLPKTRRRRKATT